MVPLFLIIFMPVKYLFQKKSPRIGLEDFIKKMFEFYFTNLTVSAVAMFPTVTAILLIVSDL